MSQDFFCNMNALTKEQRNRHQELAHILRPASTGLAELENGYELMFDPIPNVEICLAEFIHLEQLCCPFFSLDSELSTGNELALLRITGPGDIKPFIRAEFGIGESPAESSDA